MNKCSCSVSCAVIGGAISLIFGAIIGLLFYFGVIALATIPLTTILALGFVSLFAITALFVLSHKCELSRCLCRLKGILLTGAIGTFITALAAFLVLLTAGSVVSAIIVGLGAFFLALLLSAAVCLINCVSDCD